MSKQGKLVVFSAPSGCGKGTVLPKWLAQRDDTVVSISVTTRAPRPGEVDGVHYFFRTREQVEQMIANGELLEYAEYNGNLYGTPLPPINGWLAEGKNVVLEIEVQGADKVMQKCKNALTVFLVPPSVEELERRLRGRGTETEESIQMRLAASKKEFLAAKMYDYVVCNDVVEKAVARMDALLCNEMKQ